MNTAKNYGIPARAPCALAAIPALVNIYDDPDLYDLEHADGGRDVRFFVTLARKTRPARILEIGCGDGRVTLPLAQAARDWGGRVAGLDPSAAMLDQGRGKDSDRCVDWHEGDVRNFRSGAEFDWIFSACGSMSHLLEMDDQWNAWQNVARHLAPGGRFVVAELMADLPTLAESQQSPPRAAVVLDQEQETRSGERLVRYRAIRYRADRQETEVQYLYDHFAAEENSASRRITEYRGHVFFPNELQLLFRATGFEVENIWGDYQGTPLRPDSRHLIVCGRRL